MSKMEDVRAQMVQAMKSGEKERKEALSMLLAALKAKFIDKREELTEEEENAVVLRELKQTKETLESAPADRADIREQCERRITVLQEFAPREMSEEEIRRYVATGEPMDKAGAYGIQGKCAIFVDKIDGDYNNVVGLPVAAIYRELKKLGIDIYLW